MWGIPHPDNLDNRYTYLTPDLEEAECHGNVTLEVDYEPVGGGIDNFGFNPPPGYHCWQFCVFIPIPIGWIKRL